MFREFVVGLQRQEAEHNRTMLLAWTIEALHRHKKMPTLKSLCRTRKERDKPQTVGQLKAMLHQLSERYGIPLRKGKPRG